MCHDGTGGDDRLGRAEVLAECPRALDVVHKGNGGLVASRHVKPKHTTVKSITMLHQQLTLSTVTDSAALSSAALSSNTLSSTARLSAQHSPLTAHTRHSMMQPSTHRPRAGQSPQAQPAAAAHPTAAAHLLVGEFLLWE